MLLYCTERCIQIKKVLLLSIQHWILLRFKQFRHVPLTYIIILILIIQESSIIDSTSMKVNAAFCTFVMNYQNRNTVQWKHRTDISNNWKYTLQKQHYVMNHMNLNGNDDSDNHQVISNYPADNTAINEASVALLKRTKQHVERLQQQQRQQPFPIKENDVTTPSSSSIAIERVKIYESYIQLPASILKSKCIERQINEKGRKPDLAHRLTQDDIISIYGIVKNNDNDNITNETSDMLINGMDALVADSETSQLEPSPIPKKQIVLKSFAGLFPLSIAAQTALLQAQFIQPTIIQSKVIPIVSSGQSVIIHAATGSGKTLAYLLPITERIWYDNNHNNNNNEQQQQSVAFILTPTRELAAQVAGIATILAPPGTVRFVTQPCNLLRRMKQERTDYETDVSIDTPTRIYVGSAKVVYQSLYGNGKMPAAPTTKPEAMFLLQNTVYLVLDEVDRLLGVVGGVNNHQQQHEKYKSKSSLDKSNIANKHEKPAAIITAAVTRLTLGKAITVAASATVGRPLRRELARCMGLTPQECPIIIRDDNDTNNNEEENITNSAKINTSNQPLPISSNIVSRAVTIPSTVKHYIIPVIDGASPGKILTSAFTTIQSLGPNRRILLVLTRNFGITTQNAIGALKHFQCQPEPISLLDALESTDGTKAMIEIHRQVTGVSGIGSSQQRQHFASERQNNIGYLLVTGEDSVRGLHLDGLDVVVVASRSSGPDEYTHIAGRTGRAGKSGSVINIVNEIDVNKVTAWEKMLNLTFLKCSNPKNIGSIIDENDVDE
jgi:superfamily II DNA/RNA helicase